MYYALVLEDEGFEFLIGTRDLWRPECVHVRRGRLERNLLVE